MRPRFLAVFSLLAAACAQTPVPQDQGLTRLYQDLQQLKTTARVMMVTAHPDDEDGGLLTLLARSATDTRTIKRPRYLRVRRSLRLRIRLGFRNSCATASGCGNRRDC